MDFGDLNAMNVALITAISVAAVLILAWLVRRTIRRRHLSSLRMRRHVTSGLGSTDSDSDLFARPRPEKTEIVRTIVIGSEDDVDARFDDEGVSSRHAELFVLRSVDSSPLMPLEPIYYLRDMTGTHGIEVLRDGNWVRFQADVVLNDEQLKIGEVESTADEINRLAIESKLATHAEDVSPH